MLLDVFATRIAYLEGNNRMRLDLNPTRTVRRARKALAHALTESADATTARAQRRADRRANAAKRRMVEADRAAWDWEALA